MKEMKFKRGDKVKDIYTGYTGKVTEMCSYETHTDCCVESYVRDDKSGICREWLGEVRLEKVADDGPPHR